MAHLPPNLTETRVSRPVVDNMWKIGFSMQMNIIRNGSHLSMTFLSLLVQQDLKDHFFQAKLGA